MFLNEGIIPVNSKQIKEDLLAVIEKMADKFKAGGDRVESLFRVSACKALQKYRVALEQSSNFDDEDFIKSSMVSHKLGLDGATVTVGDEFITVFYLSSVVEVLADEKNWPKFVGLFESLVAHELVHREQLTRQKSASGKTHMRRNGDLSDDDEFKKYLAHHTEIMAWAQQAALELLNLARWTPEDAIRVVVKGPEYAARASDSFATYHSIFDKTDKAYKEFVKSVIEYIEQAQKP